MIERIERAPNAKDRDAIGRQIAAIEKDRREEIVLSASVCALGVIGGAVFLYVTRPVHPLTAAIVVAVLAVAILFGGPTYRGWRAVVDWKGLRKSRFELNALRAFMAGGRVRVLHCEASDLVAILDDDDEIEWFAFQVEPELVLVLPAWSDLQQGFPSTVFEVVSKADDDEEDFLAIHALGASLKPRARVRQSKLKNSDWLDDEWEIGGRLADLTRH